MNDSITSLLDSAVAGTTTLSSDADVVLTDTSGAANTAREAIILWTAGGTDTRYITAPARSKAYLVINKSSSTQSIVLRGVGPTTGVTIVKGESAVCAWNGSDFIKVSNTSGAGVFTSVTDSALTSGRVTYASTGGLLVDSASLTFNGTTLTASGFSGPLGATAANTGAFTTLSASSTVSGAGFSTYLASPPAIGGTAAAAGAFTTLSASSTVSGTGFSAYLASPPAIGGTTAAAITGTTITANTAFAGPINGTVGATTPSTGAFTTLSASSTVSGTGFSTYLASPPAIGGTAAAAGSFTALSYSTTLTGGTGIVNLGSGQFYKDASGNVGIGTASPTAILNAYNATSALISLEGGAQTAFVGTRYSTDTNPSQAILRKTRGTQASPTAVATSDTAGGVYMQAYGGTTYRNIARVDGLVETYTSDTNIAGALRFYTNNSSTDVTEWMRITSSGNVGIGTGSPGYKLSVSTSTQDVANFISSNTKSIIYLTDSGTTTGYVSINSEGNALVLNGAGNERIRIASSTGYVGISNNSPQAFLDVGGDALISGLSIGKGLANNISNTVVGKGALAATTTGSNNTAFGAGALAADTTGSNNTAVGYNALNALTTSTANNNTAIGYLAASGLTNTSASNVFVGSSAGGTSSGPGSFCVIVGASAGTSLSSSSNNTFIGYRAGASAPGTTNTFVGYQAGLNISTASNCTVLGSYTGSGSTSSNFIFISDGAGSARIVINDVGTLFTTQVSPTNKAAAATLTGAEVLTQIITCSGASGFNLTMPTGTDLDAATGGALTSTAFNVTFVNGTPGSVGLSANTGITITPSASITTATSATFRVRRTGANTFVMYRM